METSNYNFTDPQKESCAVNLMRDTIEVLSLRDGISYENALLHFTSSKVYDALFDYATGIWRESPDYLLNLYDYCNSKSKNSNFGVKVKSFAPRQIQRRLLAALVTLSRKVF